MQLPYALRVRRCVNQSLAPRLPDVDARWNPSRRLNLEMRDLEARQPFGDVPSSSAIQIATQDAKVCGDIQHPLCVIADDIVHWKITGACWCRESCRAGLHVQVRERAGAGAGTFDDVEDVPWSAGCHGIITGVRYPGVVHVRGIRID